MIEGKVSTCGKGKLTRRQTHGRPWWNKSRLEASCLMTAGDNGQDEVMDRMK